MLRGQRYQYPEIQIGLGYIEVLTDSWDIIHLICPRAIAFVAGEISVAGPDSENWGSVLSSFMNAAMVIFFSFSFFGAA